MGGKDQITSPIPDPKETTEALPLLCPQEKGYLVMLELCSAAMVLAGLPAPPRDTLCQAELAMGVRGGLAPGTFDPLATLPALGCGGWGRGGGGESTYHLPWGARGRWPLPGL